MPQIGGTPGDIVGIETKIAEEQKPKPKQPKPKPVAPYDPEAYYGRGSVGDHLYQPIEPAKVPSLVVDVKKPVPLTGEPWANFFDRRFGDIYGRLPKFGTSFAAELASAKISDDELDKVLEGLVLQQSTGILKPLTLVQERQLSAQREQAMQQAIDAAEKRFPNVRETAEQRVSQDMGGVYDPELLKEKYGPDVDTFDEAVRTEIIGIASKTHSALNFYMGLDEKGQPQDLATLSGLLGPGEDPSLLSGLKGVGELGLGVIGGGLEELYHGVSRPVSTALQVISSNARSALPGGPSKWLSPAKAWNRSVALGPGRAWAYSAGMAPGTAPFRVASATADTLGRIFLDPLVVAGKVTGGIKLAERLPGLAGAAAQAPARGIRGAVWNMLKRSPEELVAEGRTQEWVSRVWEDVKGLRTPDEQKVALNMLMERHGIDARIVEDFAAARTREELEQRVVDGLYGRIGTHTREVLEGKLVGVEKDIDALTRENISHPALDGLRAQRDSLKETLADGWNRRTAVLRETPGKPPVLNRIKQSIKRAEKDTPLGRTLVFLTADNWVADWAHRGLPMGRIPHRAISLLPEDLNEAAIDFRRVAKIVGLSGLEIDEYTSRFVGATSQGEMHEIYNDMLKLARKDLGPFGTELTQYSASPGSSVYWVDRKGQAFRGWARRVRRGADTIEFEQPHLWSQLHQSLPLPDLKNIIRARTPIGRLRDVLRVSRSPLARFAGEAIRAEQVVVSALTSGFWVPAVLMRLGWPIRVLSEELIRLAAVGGFPLEDSPLNIFGRVATRKAAKERVLAAAGKAGTEAPTGIALHRAVTAAMNAEDPQEVLAHMGRLALDSRSTLRGTVYRGSSRYYEGLTEALQTLRDDPVTRFLASNGPDQTERWLKTAGRKYYQDMKGVIDNVAEARGVPASERMWVDLLEEDIHAVAPSEKLRQAIGTGHLDVDELPVPLVDASVPGKLRTLPEGELPLGVREPSGYWRTGGETLWRRGVSAVMDTLGSKPTNWLNRRPAFRFFHGRELERLKALGVPEPLAIQQARQYAIRRVGDILYDASERTAFDAAVRNVSPFLPAWKEVFKRWLVTIPSETGGMGIGHAVLARRVATFVSALEGDGLVVKNQDGSLEVRAEGLDTFLQHFLGVKTVRGGFGLQSFNMLGNFPGMGLVPSTIAARLVQDSKRLGEILQPLYPYGFDSSLGPRGLTRVLQAIGINPPWAPFDVKYQQVLFDMSVADVMRSEFKPELEALQKRTQAMLDDPKTATKAMQEDLAADLRSLQTRAEEEASSVMLRRGLLGLLSPVQPRLYWPGQEEMTAFRTQVEIHEKLGGDVASAVREFKDRHPELVLSFAPKTTRIDGELPRDNNIQDFYRDLRSGAIKTLKDEYGDEAAVKVFVGVMSYESIRRREREALSELDANNDGVVTGDDWAHSADQYLAIRAKASEDRQLLRQINPTWAEFWDKRIENAEKRAGEPMPTLFEERTADVIRNVRDFGKMFPDEFAPISGDVGAALAHISDALNLDRFFGAPSQGPDRDFATYMGEVYVPYWREIGKLREQLDAPGLGDAERDGIRSRIRKLRNGYWIGIKEAFGVADLPSSEPDHVIEVYVSDPLALKSVQGAVRMWNGQIGADVLRIVDSPTPTSITASIDPKLGSAGLAKGRSVSVRPEYNNSDVFMHELGHQLGLKHDKAYEVVNEGDSGMYANIPNAAEIAKVRELFGIKTEKHKGFFTEGDHFVDLADIAKYPSPEEFSYLRKTEPERRLARARWMVAPISFLSPFQRQTVGMPENQSAVEFWAAVLDFREKIKTATAFGPSTKAAIALRGWRDEQELAIARSLGLEHEYHFSKMPLYKRVDAAKFFTSEGWPRLVHYADAVHDTLDHAEVGPSSQLGRQLQASLYGFMPRLRKAYPDLDSELNLLQMAMPDFVGGSVDSLDNGFYRKLLFEKGD